MLRHAMRALPLLIVWIGGCDAGSYEVAVAFDPSALADDARSVELALVPDCDAQALGGAPSEALQAQTLTRAMTGMALEPTPPGSYGLYARARSADCSIVAAGCAPVELVAGGSGVLRVTLSALSGDACASGEVCSDGVCLDGDQDGGPRDAGPADAAPDGGPLDAGPECADATECDDSVACTVDSCESGVCVFTPDDSSCAAGEEVCQLVIGCAVPCTEAEQCDDGEACTSDRCDAGRCVYTTADVDEDLHGDATCPELGGVPADDCDDGNPEVFPGAAEICNGGDDDCDNMRDEDFDCVFGEDRACSACGLGRQQCNGSCTGFGDCVPADAVALWSFDAEPDDTRFTDRVGAHDGAYRSVATRAPVATRGPFGCGEGVLYAADGWGEVADDATFDIEVGTFSAWVRFDLDDVAQGVFSRDELLFGTPGHFTITRRDTNVLEARIQDGTDSFFRCTEQPVAGGAWLELVVHFGRPDFEFIVDGVPATGCAPDVTTSGIVGANNPLVFGASQQTSDPGTSVNTYRFLDGAIDHVWLSSRRAAANVPEVTNLVLVDADADASLGVLDEGAVLTLAELPGITVRATTDPGSVGSVTFTLDGTLVTTEGVLPYSLEDELGDFTPFDFATGAHTLEVTPYTGTGATGVAGPTRTVRFEVR